MNSEKFTKGVETFNKIHGGLTAEKTIKDLQLISPELAQFSMEWIFCDIYSRKQLNVKTREFANIAALVMHGSALPQLENHIRAGLNVGCTQTEILEVILQMTIMAGFPSVVNAMLLAKNIFAEIVQNKYESQKNILLELADTACFDYGEYDKAMSLYNKQLYVDPCHSLALSRRGNIFRYWNNLNSALYDIDTAIELDADNHYAYLTKVRILVGMNDRTEAMDIFRKVASIDTIDIRVLQQLAAAQSALELYKEALVTCSKILSLRPEDAATWYTQGVAFSAMNHPSRAVASFDKALHYRPKHADTISRRNSLLNTMKLNTAK